MKQLQLALALGSFAALLTAHSVTAAACSLPAHPDWEEVDPSDPVPMELAMRSISQYANALDQSMMDAACDVDGIIINLAVVCKYMSDPVRYAIKFEYTIPCVVITEDGDFVDIDTEGGIDAIFTANGSIGDGSYYSA